MALESSAYPVTMLKWSDNALLQLEAELIMTEIVGSKRTYNIAASFDTENSSFLSESDGMEVAVTYVWMFGIGDTVVYGRRLDDFVELITRLNKFLSARLIVYVHFLKYDFSFIKKLFNWDDVFVRDMREPLYAVTGNIEFRDSLVLSGGKGLATIGEELRRPVYKAVGDLDYRKLRLSQTPMTQQELHYCEMDIRVLNEYIREKIEDDGNILKIPYTNTGYVRNYVREQCFKNRGQYMEFIDNLTLTPDAYLQCEKAFSGGAVGPNIKYANTLESSVVHSYDIKSSYPYVMCVGYFPMSYPLPVKNREANRDLKKLIKKYCCQFTLEVFGLFASQDHCFPISEHKCNELIGARTASGRVMAASYVSINVTELDYITIARFYDLENAEEVRVSRMRIYEKGRLPEPIIKSVLKFFFDKTTLDGVEGKERAYMISKNMLNSVYGMMVEKIVRAALDFSADFVKGKPDYEKQVVEYNEKRNRFLYYPWGVWVTAQARYRLYDAIYNIGDDWRYCDTDSVKFVGEHTAYFEEKNKQAYDNLVKLAQRLHMPLDRVIPLDSSGTPKVLGVWEHEYDCNKFKTLGAKRYMVEYSWPKRKAGKIELTVAGSNKKSTLEYIKQKALESSVSPFDVFQPDLVIPPEYAGRTISTFIDERRSGYATDYLGNRYWYEQESGVHISDSSYTFSITEEMLEAINFLVHDGHYTQGEI